MEEIQPAQPVQITVGVGEPMPQSPGQKQAIAINQPIEARINESSLSETRMKIAARAFTAVVQDETEAGSQTFTGEQLKVGLQQAGIVEIPKDETLLMSPLERQHRPIVDIAKEVQNKLIELDKSSEPKTKEEIFQLIIGDCQEIKLQHSFDQLFELLNKQERNLLLSVTQENAVKQMANIFNETKNLEDSYSLAKRAFGLHRELFSAISSAELRLNYPDAPAMLLKLITASSFETELSKMYGGTILEVMRNHPKWTKAAFDLFLKHILPLIIGKQMSEKPAIPQSPPVLPGTPA